MNTTLFVIGKERWAGAAKAIIEIYNKWRISFAIHNKQISNKIIREIGFL
jgi:hypothetical protein